MNNIDINISRSESGNCEKCGIQSDDMYNVTLSQGEKSKTYHLCRNCTAATKRFVEKKNKEHAEETVSSNNVKEQCNSSCKNMASVNNSSNNKSGFTRLISIASIAVLIFAVIIAVVVGVSKANKNDDIDNQIDTINDNSGSIVNYDESLTDKDNSDKNEVSSSKPSGIITLSLKNNGIIEIHCINPDTGASYLVSSFDGNNNNRNPHWYNNLFSGFNQITRKEDFSSDFRKIAFNLTDTSSGHTYSYWMDDEGSFTNVYTSVFGTPGDFDSKVTCNTYGFDSKDRYYFNVKINEDTKYYRVSANDLSKNSLEDLTGIITNSTTCINSCPANYDYDIYNLMLFDESDHIAFKYNRFRGEDIDNRSNKLVLDYTELSTITSWGDDFCYKSFKEKDYPSALGIYYVQLNQRDNPEGNTYERILNVDGRSVVDAMLSPDKTKIAFVSWVHGQQNGELFISGLKGENPKKINTDIAFRCWNYNPSPSNGFELCDREFFLQSSAQRGDDNIYILAWV